MEREYEPSGESGEDISRLLSGLPRRIPPPGLTTSLRVIASRERQRNLSRRGFCDALTAWRDRMRLAANNVMRPVALPAAGGIFSAVVLLGIWMVPNYPVRADSGPDVPTMLSTDATVKEISTVEALTNIVQHSRANQVVVDVIVDDQGRMVDYEVVSGPSTADDPEFRHRLQNLLLFTEFIPATAFGQPGFGKVRLTLFSSYVDVKG